jgi:hypothetical protein
MLTILVVFAFIIGCNMTEEEAIDAAKETFTVGVKSESQQPNQETESFSYFLPPILNVEEKNGNNLILSRDNQIYLIFSNPAEDDLSEVNFEENKVFEEKTILIETLKNEETFNYLIISPFGDNEYKIIVGRGGEKGTTITDIQNINDSIETIIEIITSVSY